MKFSFDEKHLFYRELAKLSAARFPLPEALGAISDTNPPAATRSVIGGVKSRLAEGKTIGEAFTDLPEAKLTDLEEAIVTASERGGLLEEGFDHLADYFSMRDQTAKTIRRKMRYPLFLLHFVIIVAGIALVVGAEDKMQALTLSIGSLLVAYLVLFIAVVVGRHLAAKAETDTGADKLLARIPLIGAVRQNLALARFSTVFRMHLLAGERIDEGLRSAANASQSARLIEAIEKGAIPTVNEGQPVGPALAKHPEVFTSTFARGFSTAENSGTLDSDLQRWSQRFHDEAREAMGKLGTHAPKYFYAFVVVIALWQILRLVMLIFGIYAKHFELLDEI
ncbi:MAG: type II secretory pathway component PulF [Pseudoalteromonas tetraodonis]|jgi:type II secretory pathway component PulF